MRITDKQRLDWLDGVTGLSWVIDLHCADRTKKYDGIYTFNDDGEYYPGPLRQAIDAAIRAQEKRK